MRGTDAKNDFVAASFSLSGGEARRDAEAMGRGGDLGDRRFGRIVVHERDREVAKVRLVAEERLEREIGNDDGGEHVLRND